MQVWYKNAAFDLETMFGETRKAMGVSNGPTVS